MAGYFYFYCDTLHTQWHMNYRPCNKNVPVTVSASKILQVLTFTGDFFQKFYRCWQLQVTLSKKFTGADSSSPIMWEMYHNINNWQEFGGHLNSRGVSKIRNLISITQGGRTKTGGGGALKTLYRHLSLLKSSYLEINNLLWLQPVLRWSRSCDQLFWQEALPVLLIGVLANLKGTYVVG